MNNSQRLNNFNLIRLLAAMQVMVSHTYEWLKIPINPYFEHIIKLFPGVAIFFVISGFLIVKSYIEGQGNLKYYITGRLLRIYPGIWVNILLITLILCATNQSNHVFAIQHWPYHVIMLFTGQMWGGIFGGDPFTWNGFYKFFPNPVFWTITVEIGFYILVPIFFKPFIKNDLMKFNFFLISVFFISFCISILNANWLTKNPPLHHITTYLSIFLRNTLPPYLWIFLLGSIFYLKWGFFHRLLQEKFIYWLIIYLLFDLYFFHHYPLQTLNKQLENFYPYTNISNTIRVIILSFCVISFAYSFKSIGFLNRKVDLSYGIYLYHMPIVSTLLSLKMIKSNYLWLVVISCAYLLALLSWLLIEKPALNFKKILLKTPFLIKQENLSNATTSTTNINPVILSFVANKENISE